MISTRFKDGNLYIEKGFEIGLKGVEIRGLNLTLRIDFWKLGHPLKTVSYGGYFVMILAWFLLLILSWCLLEIYKRKIEDKSDFGWGLAHGRNM